MLDLPNHAPSSPYCDVPQVLRLLRGVFALDMLDSSHRQCLRVPLQSLRAHQFVFSLVQFEYNGGLLLFFCPHQFPVAPVLRVWRAPFEAQASNANLPQTLPILLLADHIAPTHDHFRSRKRLQPTPQSPLIAFELA